MATEAQTLIENLPVSLSGAPVERIAHRQVQFAEEYTGKTIGSTGIALQFQPALVDLTIADVLNYMQLTGGDFSNIRLGDFSISKGAQGNLQTASDFFKKQGMIKLQEIGRSVRYIKVYA